MLCYVDFYSQFNYPEKEMEFLFSKHPAFHKCHRFSTEGLKNQKESSSTVISALELYLLRYLSFIGQQ